MIRRIAALALLLASRASLAQSVSVTLPPGDKPYTGRVLVYLIGPRSHVGARQDPTDAIFEEDPQPIFGADIVNADPTRPVVLDEKTEGFLPEKVRATLADLPAGKYKVQAALVLNREEDWRQAPGNYTSEVATAELGPGKTVTVKLTDRTERREWPRNARGSEEFTLKSKLLSEFWHRDVILRAGVRFPYKQEEGKRYAAVYEIPGFGGSHFAAARGGSLPGPGGPKLGENTFLIILNPNSPYGHTFFMDSDNIGPWARALREELIPALEAKYALISKPEARLLRGHSSGGWSTLWLATEYADTFGATWSSSPDPVDFRRFEKTDIYRDESFFVDRDPPRADTPSARIGGGPATMTVRQEFTQEDVIGPGYTSAQQWASWQACWGHRNADGTLRPLFDRLTGNIDRAEAESYRRFDIADRLRKDPKRFVPLFRNNVRLMVGDKDDYYLDEAVRLLDEDLEKLDPGGKGNGYVKFVPGVTHQAIFMTPDMWAVPDEMLAHLKRSGILKE